MIPNKRQTTMGRTSAAARWGPGLLAALLLAGCIGGESKPSRYFILEAPAAVTEAAALQDGVTVAVSEIELPKYLDRPQIVLRTGSNEIFLSEFDRWIEPLEQNFARVLVENLSGALNSNRVRLTDRVRDADFVVEIDVLAFDAYTNGRVALSANWRLSAREGREAIATRRSDLSAQGDPKSYASIVRALSETIATLSSEIAAATGAAKPAGS